jgi:hypothetical protein
MEEIVGLRAKERSRLVELELVRRGRDTLRAASERLELSRRQMRRTWAYSRRRRENAETITYRVGSLEPLIRRAISLRHAADTGGA